MEFLAAIIGHHTAVTTVAKYDLKLQTALLKIIAKYGRPVSQWPLLNQPMLGC